MNNSLEGFEDKIEQLPSSILEAANEAKRLTSKAIEKKRIACVLDSLEAGKAIVYDSDEFEIKFGKYGAKSLLAFLAKQKNLKKPFIHRDLEKKKIYVFCRSK